MRLRKIKWLVQITKAIRGRIGSWTLLSLFSAQSFPYSFPRPFSSIISITNAVWGLRSKVGSPFGIADQEGFQSCPDLPGGWDWYRESLEPRIVVGRWVCGMWRYSPKGGWNHKVGPSASLMAQMVRNLPACRRPRFNSWVRKISWRRDRLPAPVFMGFPGRSDGKESACNLGDLGSIPGLGSFPGGRHGNPFQYSCLENPHGQKNLAGYSPWGHKELDTTEQLTLSLSFI